MDMVTVKVKTRPVIWQGKKRYPGDELVMSVEQARRLSRQYLGALEWTDPEAVSIPEPEPEPEPAPEPIFEPEPEIIPEPVKAKGKAAAAPAESEEAEE